MPFSNQGITSNEAAKRLEEYGANVLPEKPPPTSLSVLLSQLKSPLVYILLIACVLTFFLGDYSDALIITIAVLINTILGFLQEKKAGQALTALKKMVNHQAEVIRGGESQKISAWEIVPGDVVILRAGYKVPADGELFWLNRLSIDEAALTGESVPVTKEVKQEVFMGTIIASGSAMMCVTKTGAQTQIGEIAKEVQETHEETPLMRQLSKFSKSLVIVVLALTSGVFLIGILTGRPLLEMFSISIALSVSAIPEGLLVGLTVVLAIGMERIVRRKGLVRRLASAETLGGVTVICLDKTGTLTEGKMSVVDSLGDTKTLALQMLIANDMDDDIVLAGHEWASQKIQKIDAKNQMGTGERIDTLPFSSEERFFAALHTGEKANTLFVNGAPDYILNWSNLSKKEKQRQEQIISELTSKGYRLLGLASKKTLKTKIDNSDVKSGLIWHGILAFTDPVRVGVAESLAKAQKAGIKLLVITGDYPQTARAIMQGINLPISEHEVMTGQELAELDIDELSDRLSSIKLFARTTPQQKLKIVEALRNRGEVVAMMGDGVNDAPALTKADIGIVVGSATDVARESADLVLLDSKFETVIAAIEEGRGMYSNVQKMILYLMSTAFNEIIAVFGSILLGLPLAVTAAQILWINVVSDSLPNMSLTIEPKPSRIMTERPRNSTEPLLARWMQILIGIVSIISGLSVLILFVYVYTITKDAVLARSVCFFALGINSLVYIFSIRTLLRPFWIEGIFANKWLIASVGVGIILQGVPFIFPNLRNFFGLAVLPYEYWILIGVTTFIVFFVIELVKLAIRSSLKQSIH
jgi:P-type Ca2+ transporter type 2C